MEIFFVLSYVDYCVYWYTSEGFRKCFVDYFGNRFHVKFLVYKHWFMSIRISNMKDHYIYVDQDRYDTSIVTKYLDTSTVNSSTLLYTINKPMKQYKLYSEC